MTAGNVFVEEGAGKESGIPGAVVVAAGRSRRMGFNKLLAPLAGMPVFLHSLAVWWSYPGLGALVLVVPEGEEEVFGELVRGHLGEVEGEAAGGVRLVAGGAERTDSVRAGVLALPGEIEWVAVHDAARPLLTHSMIERCLAGARETGAAVCAEPCHDTLHRSDESGLLREAVSRENLWRMQTPQIFRRERLIQLLEGVRESGEVWTDEAGIALRAGDPVAVVNAGEPNFKVTLPADLDLAEALMGAQERGETQ